MRFSERFNINRTVEDDWFDPVLTGDTPLYIDPFLIFDEEDERWASSRERLVKFFALAGHYIEQANGNRQSPHWEKALRLLSFPEPKEFALGLSMGHPEGSGIGLIHGKQIAEALHMLNAAGVQGLDNVQAFSLFCEGLGVDRISDMLCNILKSTFIIYTQDIAKRHRLELKSVPVRHADWSPRYGRWTDAQVELPASPAFSGGVLLAPARFLKDIPTVSDSGFWGWAEKNEGEILRQDLGYDLSADLTPTERANAGHRLAQRTPNLVMAYLKSLEEQEHAAYDISADTKMLVRWQEKGQEAFDSQANVASIDQPEDFNDWVGELMNQFKHAVEETDLWKALWNDAKTRHRPEKIVQAIAGSQWVAHCNAANVDLSKEVNMGRGPVDFKFSAGWRRRALTEVKLLNSGNLFTGASKQILQYLKTEKISCGFYVCVGFYNEDLSENRLKRVSEECEALQGEHGFSVTPIFIDARHDNKPSASKQK